MGPQTMDFIYLIALGAVYLVSLLVYNVYKPKKQSKKQ